jgi:hypothetical protein
MRTYPDEGVLLAGLPSNTLLFLGHEDTSSSRVYDI